MTPLGHLATALLAARGAGFDRRRSHLCLIGALLPDIVDKPLWRAGVFVTGHTVAHSVIVVCTAAALLAVVPRPRYSYPVTDSELSDCFTSVEVSEGLLFDEANTESTASFRTVNHDGSPS